MEKVREFRGRFTFLSNFYIAPFTTPAGNRVMSVEHGYQAAKTRDPAEAKEILNADSPKEAKRMGRKVSLRLDWGEARLRVMEKLLKMKFEQNEKLAKRLLATEGAELEEGNYWHDTFWGVCHCERCGSKGANWLGHLLMELRVAMRLRQKMNKKSQTPKMPEVPEGQKPQGKRRSR